MKKDPMVKRAAKEYQAILRRGMKKPKKNSPWRICLVGPEDYVAIRWDVAKQRWVYLTANEVKHRLNRYERLKAKKVKMGEG